MNPDNNTIQNAINNAGNDDKIYLSDGVYKGSENRNITLNKNWLLFGQSKDKTIIDGENAVRLFYTNSGTLVTFINISFINGNNSRFVNGNTLGSPGPGGAITSSGNLNIENCYFRNNIADSGGAIEFYGNQMIL